MYSQIAIVIVCLIGISWATNLVAPLPAENRFWLHQFPQVAAVHQLGSSITAPVFGPIISSVRGQVAVLQDPTRYDSFLIRIPSLLKLSPGSHVPGVARVPTVVHVPAAVPVAGAAVWIAAPASKTPNWPQTSPELVGDDTRDIKYSWYIHCSLYDLRSINNDRKHRTWLLLI